MTDTIRTSRAIAAAHGLALGDALGAPASVHRTIRDPWVRSMLRQGTAELDRARVLRPVVPFVLSALGAAPMTPTDDAEAFAVAAQVLIAVGARGFGTGEARTAAAAADDAAGTAAMFGVWSRIMGADDVWTGTAQRSALENGEIGLLPPQTGRDNPAFYDDSVLPGSIAVGMAVADPALAAAIGRRFATITHDAIGVTAAGAVAALVARLLGEEPLEDALAASATDIAENDWLAEGFHEATATLEASGSPFAAIPALIARFAPRNYSHPGTVAETLPLALALVGSVGGDHERALPLAMSIARHQDSLPALVGALCGAAGSPVDGAMVDALHGVTVPSTAGLSLREVARELTTLS